MKLPPLLLSVFWIPLFFLSLVWTLLAVFRRWIPTRSYCAEVPVICVGNLSMGGSGKTPLVAALAKVFAVHRPAIISRGYKGLSEKTGARVELTAADGARRYGDEPWMLGHQTGVPVYVGKDRAKSAKRAVADGAGVLLFDDGFQNRGVRYTLSVLLLGADAYCFPLGNLRESLSARSRADLVVSKGDDAVKSKNEGLFDATGKTAEMPPGKFGAFCGVGQPEPFFKLFRDQSRLAYERSFADHYWYTASDLEELNQAGETHGLAGWITTEKDWYRLQEVRGQIRLPLFWSRLTAELSRDFLKLLDVFGDLK